MLFGLKRRQDGSGRFDDPEGVGGAAGVNTLFTTDMSATSGVGNGFDSWNIQEASGDATLVWNGSVARYNLGAAQVNDLYAGKAIGDHVNVGSGPEGELYITFNWLCTNFNALTTSDNQFGKILLINWTDGSTTQRQFQIIVSHYRSGGSMYARLEWLRWVPSFESAWATSIGTVELTEDALHYFKLRILNSNNGATDGAVQLWIDGTLACENLAIALNRAGQDYYPNLLILGTYNSNNNGSEAGAVEYDNFSAYDGDPGSWAPASMPTWTGLSGSTITADDVFLDFRTDASVNAPSILRNTNGAAQSFDASGGFYGTGINNFTPNQGVTQQYLGIGTISGFASVGDASRVTIGALMTWGQGFIDNWMRESYKWIVLIRNPNDATHVRPMAIVKGGSTEALCPGNGTICNCNDDPVNNPEPFNSTANAQPDINALANIPIWVEFQVDCNGPYGWITLKVWSSDSVFQGQTLAQIMTNGGGAGETFGGVIQTLDTMSYLEQASAPGGSPANPAFGLEYMRIKTGQYADITPTPGFPGHVAANW
ncbi:MAG: hypothetical protein JAY90_20290 [Candidatus Thiodiazotropha lotti]|nr:hypothetical protein [Candidatus Thiodiazotropha lotti]